MTESAKKLWDAVDLEINDWIGDGDEAYCLTDERLDAVKEYWSAGQLVNKIGLKRRIGKVLKARGYTETSTSPPTWVKTPPAPEPAMTFPGPIFPQEIPRYIIDMYLSLLQSEAILEQQYPDIVKAVGQPTAQEGP